MKPGNIIFVHGKGPISDAIEHFDEGPFSHVCMAMPYETIVESQYFVNTRCIPNPYHQNVTIVDLGLTAEERQDLIMKHFKYLPEKYDLKQIAGILFHKLFGWMTNRTWNSKQKLICSELVVDLLHDIGYFKKHGYFYETRNLTPNSLYKVLMKTKGMQPLAR